ncbi:MAG: methyltransferase [Rhizobiaceae bacterium]
MDEAPERFVVENLRLVDVPAVPGIKLYTAHPASGLYRLKRSPYWAFPWAGGLALARHVQAQPHQMAGRHILDLGAGGGVVAIAAAKAGAAGVLAAEIDPHAIAALRLNAEANGVEISILSEDLLGGEPPPVDLVLVGDLFYTPTLARRVANFLDRCRAAGIDVLVGDPGRGPLPLDRLTLLAEYDVPDFGGGSGARGGVYGYG